jgi:two-component system OmpR family sensor kinase
VVASAPAGASPPALAPTDYAAVGTATLRPYYIAGNGDTESLVVLHNLARNGHRVGAVQMSQPTAVLKQTQQRLLTILAVATAALMLVAVVLVPLLVRRALMPLRRVTEASAELAGGDFARRVEEPRSRDELGRVARAFNEMAGAVQRAVNVRAESEAGMRHFVGDASHELRTPLTTLQGQLDLLGRGAAADPEAQRVALTAMQREVNRMSVLVDDLLTLTRLEAAESVQGRVREPVDIDALISDAVDEQSVRAPGQQVSIDAASPGQAVALGDPEELRRVMLNLSNNALAHAPGGVHMWHSRTEDGEVVFSLSDQGPGISADALPRLFDRFYRAQPPNGQPGPGSGLGLAIVRSIVEAHGGTVEAAPNPAGGAIITVRLPRASTTARPS